MIVGAGGIGSQLVDLVVPALTAGGIADQLGGVQLNLLDSDRVEADNLAHQRHEPRMVGRLKVESLAERLAPFLSPSLTIEAVGVDLREPEQLAGQDLVVVAVDRPEARLMVHAHADRWVDLRCGGDGYQALDSDSDAELVALVTPPDQQPASCQQPGALELGNVEMGYAMAATHGAQWLIQSLRRMVGEQTRPPSARRFSLTYGELPFPEPAPAAGGDA